MTPGHSLLEIVKFFLIKHSPITAWLLNGIKIEHHVLDLWIGLKKTTNIYNKNNFLPAFGIFILFLILSVDDLNK